MRRIQIAFRLVSAFAAAGVYAQSDPLAAIREALTAKYRLTTATADKAAIVTEGSLLTLKKSDLLTGDASSSMVFSSSYKFGKIAPGLMGKMVSGSGRTRTFVAGERFWVTDIEVRPKGIVFWLLSDQYSGVRYRASLNFPFQKGAPALADAMAMVGEVFDVEGPPVPVTVEAAAGAEHQQTPTQAGPSLVQEITGWDARYGRITSEDLARINQPGVRFDLNYLRLNPAALDEKPVMRYFIALNNCGHPDLERALFNELDYPALAAFYRAKAAQILASIPRTITDIAFDRFIGGQQMGNMRLWSQSLSLGEYDRQRHAFPLRYPGKDEVEIPDALSTGSSRNLMQGCPAAQNAASAVGQYLPGQYQIRVRPASYRELAMDEAAARQYIDSAGSQRGVFLAVDVAILDSPPSIDREANSIRSATLRAQVVRLRVIDSRTLKPLGSLFDDGSLRADAPAPAPAPPSPSTPAAKGESWSFADHMYDIRMSVYVALAADACGWPLTDEQHANVTRFLDQMSNRGNFNEKYQYSLAHSNVKNSIASKGRMNFCANSQERRDFDKYARMVAPLGPLAASGAK